MTKRIPKWPVTYFHSQCCTDQFLLYIGTYFYLFISRVWWVAILPPAPGCPALLGIQQRGRRRRRDDTFIFYLWKYRISSWHLLGVRHGVLGGMCVCVCVCVRFQVIRVVAVWACACSSVGAVRGGACAGAFGVGFTPRCTRSLLEPALGVSPARRGRLSLHAPSRGPRLRIRPTPVAFSPGNHLFSSFSPRSHRE